MFTKNTFRSLAVAALALVSVFSIATPAHAEENFSFGFSGNSGVQLLTVSDDSGVHAIQATNTGWYREDGALSNSNYIVGHCDNCGSYDFRNYFTFDLSSVVGAVTGATLTITDPQTLSTTGVNYTVHNATAIEAALLSNTASIPTYNAMGTGSVLGSTTIQQVNTTQSVYVYLNNIALAAIQALEGGTFAVSGTATAAVSNVPLPASVYMLAAALAAMGFVAQRKKSQLA